MQGDIRMWGWSRGARDSLSPSPCSPPARGGKCVCNANVQPAYCTHGAENTVTVYAKKNGTQRPQNEI